MPLGGLPGAIRPPAPPGVGAVPPYPGTGPSTQTRDSSVLTSLMGSPGTTARPPAPGSFGTTVPPPAVPPPAGQGRDAAVLSGIMGSPGVGTVPRPPGALGTMS